MDTRQSPKIAAENPTELSEVNINEEDEEENARKRVEEVLANTLIFKHILRLLERDELMLLTSFVSKYWNFWSREVLREKYCLFANPARAAPGLHSSTYFIPNCPIYSRYNEIIEKNSQNLLYSPCEVLQNFNNFLGNSFSVPFRGLTIYVCEQSDHKCISDDSATKLTSNILNKINIEFLNIGWDPESKCIMTRKCLKEIWESTSTSLADLRLRHISECNVPEVEPDSTFAEFFNIDPKSMYLPNFRRLYLTGYFKCGFANVIREFVQASPRLPELEGTIPAAGSSIIVEQDLVQFIRGFEYSPKNSQIEDGLTFAKQFPKLKRLKILTSFEPCSLEIASGSPIVVDKIKFTLGLLLQSSSTTLRYLEMSNMDLLWLTERGDFPELSGLMSLTLLFCERENLGAWQEEYERLRQINWSKQFPTLQQFKVGSRPKLPPPIRDVYENKCFWKQSSEFTCETVTTLEIVHHQFYDEIMIMITVFKTLFPEVRVLRLTNPALSHPIQNNAVSVIWTAWENLEVLDTWDVWCNSYYTVSSLLGISVTEARYLVETSAISDSLEIVPSQPGLTNLKKLKILSMESGLHFGQSAIDVFKPLVENSIDKRLPYLTGKIKFRNISLHLKRVSHSCSRRRIVYLHTLFHPFLFTNYTIQSMSPLRP